MKHIFLYFVVFYFCSCNGQKAVGLEFDTIKVSKIIIKNKVFCSPFKLKEINLIITDTDQIRNIVLKFKESKKLDYNVPLSSNYGFFDIEIIENDKSYYFGIVYTVFDGVIVKDYNNGNQYKSIHLENYIKNLFINN